MTDDNLLPFSFPAVERKKITAAFDGGRLSSDGGVMLLAQAEHRLGIAERLARVIPDERDASRVTRRLPDILRARIFAIACGYEDADDLDRLRSDPTFKLACGRLPDTGTDLCSQPTVSRWENAPSLRDLIRLTGVMVDLSRAASRRYCRSCREQGAVRADASSARRHECARAETRSLAAVAMRRPSFPGECRPSPTNLGGERASASGGKKLRWAGICGASPNQHRRAFTSCPRGRSALGHNPSLPLTENERRLGSKADIGQRRSGPSIWLNSCAPPPWTSRYRRLITGGGCQASSPSLIRVQAARSARRRPVGLVAVYTFATSNPAVRGLLA